MGLLRVACPECSGSGRFSIGRPGNPFARIYLCDACNGSGEARCHVGRCSEVATDAVVLGRDVLPMCDRHMAEYQEDVA